MSWSITGTKGGAGGSGIWTGDIGQFLGEPDTLADAKVATAAAEALADAVVASGAITYPVSLSANGHRTPDGGGSVGAAVFWSAPPAPEPLPTEAVVPDPVGETLTPDPTPTDG